MNEKEVQVWGIHGGHTGDADSLFLKKNCVAIGWHSVGDLSKLRADREAFKQKVAGIVIVRDRFARSCPGWSQ